MLRLAAIFCVLAAPVWADMRLVMIEQAGCAWCLRWDAEIAPVYPQTKVGEAAPLARMDIAETSGNDSFERRVSFTPTFVLMVDGREVGRLEGYPGEDFFWPLVEQMVERASQVEDHG